MSLYNMLFGVNPASALILAMIGTTIDKIPRFRDTYVERDAAGELILCIYTRTGGGNRDYYDSRRTTPDDIDATDGPCNDDLRALHGYTHDEDSDFDSTYASFYYKPRDEFKTLIESMFNPTQEKPEVQWRRLLTDLTNKTKTPETEAAIEIGRVLLTKLNAVVETSE